MADTAHGAVPPGTRGMRRAELGRWGEDVAVGHLEALGWELLDRNWRCELGELDVVARDGTTVVAVEVKTRRGLAAGHPLEAVTPDKLRRLRALAHRWVLGRREAGDAAGRARGLRIDVVGVLVDAAGGYAVDHVRGVG